MGLILKRQLCVKQYFMHKCCALKKGVVAPTLIIGNSSSLSYRNFK